MPFDFLKRKKGPASASAPTAKAGATEQGVPFEGLTEEWRLVARMLIDGRISDALNRRDPIDIVDVMWAPADGSAALAPAPGLKNVDPYDLVLVLAVDSALPVSTEDDRSAQRVHKVSYEVALEVPPYRVIGTVLLYPGSEPDSLLSRSTEMFVPIVDASATMGDRPVSPEQSSAILVNRAYLRGVEQIDMRTGERHTKLPGGSMGGVNWTDRAR